jgi:tRNA uridine 5-carboxymethylaminomethyl modification enzyme
MDGQADTRHAQRSRLPAAVDAVVVGGGHAGIEAAWALARLGHRVALVTFDAQALARMSCNPSVGGLAKGQLVREIDALGGLMGRLIDRTGIHFRMLNRSKGPAVHAPRAQADKEAYAAEALRVLSSQAGILLVEAEVTEIVAETAVSPGGVRRRRVTGVRMGPPRWDLVQPGGAHSQGPARRSAGRGGGAGGWAPASPGREGGSDADAIRVTAPCELGARVAVVTAGTFLRAMVFTGLDPRPGGRRGEPPARDLSGCLERLGLTMGRLKTGTPPRLARDSVDVARLAIQPGDEPPPRFSFYEAAVVSNRVTCHLTHTNERTHRVIRGALDRSPLYGGLIRGIGPRYCPSIEDKIVRFPERESHHVFLEPEGLHSETVYPNGISTSLPEDVQLTYVRTIPGLEEARIVHPGYAVEYDFLLTTQIDASMAVRAVEGLYAAGQINGTSGYEEAAAQGLMAGINAHARLSGSDPVVLARSEAYIGVLVDDLITKVPSEPYRMFTSQSEYRLLLRQDNADRRLAPLGRALGLVEEVDWRRVEERWDRVERAQADLRAHRVGRREAALARSCAPWNERSAGGRAVGGVGAWDSPGAGAPPIPSGAAGGVADDALAGKTFEDLLRRPEVHIDLLEAFGYRCSLAPDDRTTLEAEVKYDGYVRKQTREIERSKDLDNREIPERIFDAPPAQLSREAKERLAQHRPRTLGQALRIQGITQNDLMILAVHMRTGGQRLGPPAV